MAEFRLPLQFPSDVVGEMMKKKHRGSETEATVCFPYEFPYEFSSYDSLVDSVGFSPDSVSDGEDYMDGLSRQMAQYTLQDDEADPNSFGYSKTEILAGSPQSTLCSFGSGGSSRASSNGPSQVSSPPSTPMNQTNNNAWDLLSAAAGEVVRMNKMNNDEDMKLNGRGLWGLPRKPELKNENPGVGYFSNQSLAHQQLQIKQFQQLKEEQMIRQQLQNRARVGGGGGFATGRCVRPAPLGISSSAWPPLQQEQKQAGSGMRAVFLGRSGSRKESCGTGVFLPRGVGNSTEPRKKSDCSTVLVPARVVQALNLNLDRMGTHRPHFQGGKGFIYEPAEPMLSRTSSSSDAFLYQPKHENNPRLQSAMANQELRLPQEWTY